ncbi:hypothetical protein KR009_003648, partial [Drosophila setifemur]
MPQTLTPHRASLLLQMLLQANVYVSIVLGMSYLIHMLIRLNQLWNLEGLSLMVAYILAVAAESLRLYAGYSVNLCTGATSTWLLLTATPCILLPTMVFLRLSSIGRGFWLRIISNAVFVLIALEVIVALVHFMIYKPHQKRSSNNNPLELEELGQQESPEELMSPSQSEQRRRLRGPPES